MLRCSKKEEALPVADTTLLTVNSSKIVNEEDINDKRNKKKSRWDSQVNVTQ